MTTKIYPDTVRTAEATGLDLDSRIDLTKPIWEQASRLWAIDQIDESITLIMDNLQAHLVETDDPFLLRLVLTSVLSDIRASEEEHDLPAQFLRIGSCCRLSSPNQATWSAEGAFTWPSGRHGVEGTSVDGLPELDWSVLFEMGFSGWMPAEQLSGEQPLEVRIALPARTAVNNRAAVQTIWTPIDKRVFYEFRKRDTDWNLAARANFYSDDGNS